MIDKLTFYTKTKKNMRIANPIYDVFFKYLMEDIDLAKKLIAAIINEEVIELSLFPQETTLSNIKYYLSVIRLDFKAVIKTKNNEHKKVLIELQKGQVSFDILRFRKYLGENYKKTEEITDTLGNKVDAVLPIITIYLLGFELQNIPAPVLKVSHQYFDVFNKKVLLTKNDFVEKLTHDCFVIQIPKLKKEVKSKLEKILSIFNQKFISNDERILVIPKELENDKDVKEFFDRLERPLLNEDLLREAELEEDVIGKLDNMSREIEIKSQSIIEKEKELSENKKQLSEKEKTISEKEQQLLEQQKLIEELQRKLNQQ